MTRQELIIENQKLKSEYQRLHKIAQQATLCNAAYGNLLMQMIELQPGKTIVLDYKRMKSELVIRDDSTAKKVTLSLAE